MPTLRKISQAELEFCVNLEERFLSISQLWGRVKGSVLAPPASLDREMLLWRQLAVRLKKGDARIGDGEDKAMLALASWTLDLQCELIPGKKREKMPWEN